MAGVERCLASLACLFRSSFVDGVGCVVVQARSFARLEDLPEAAAIGMRHRYDTALEAFFETATAWSVVQGAAHAGNVINTGDLAVLFNLDSACWAPSVWDLTHLLHRAGTGANTGYPAAELAGLFPFTQTDVGAAVVLRRVTSLIDQARRDRGRLPAAA